MSSSLGLFGHKNETAPAHSSAGLPTGASHGVAGAGIQDPAYAQPGVGSQHQGGIGGKIHQEEAAFSGHNGLQQGGLAGQQPLGGQAGFQQGQAGVQQPGGFQQGATLNDPQRQGVLAHGHQNDHASHHHGKQAVGAGVAAGGAAGIMHELKAEEQKLKHDMAAHEQKKHHAQQIAHQEHAQAAQRLEAAKEELKAAKANEKETKRL